MHARRQFPVDRERLPRRVHRLLQLTGAIASAADAASDATDAADATTGDATSSDLLERGVPRGVPRVRAARIRRLSVMLGRSALGRGAGSVNSG